MHVPGSVRAKLGILLLLLSLGAGIRESEAQTVKLPITIDYGLLQTLILRSAYTEANQSATLLNRGSGCLYLALSKPSVSEANGLIRFETRVNVHVGTPVGDKCMVPIVWQGYLVLYQRPVIDGKTWKLSFATVNSTLLELNRQPAKIAGVAWNLIKSRVFSYIEDITIDLAPPVNDLKTFLLPLFPPTVQEQTQAMVRSLRTGESRVTPKAVVVDLLADVQEVYRPGDVKPPEALTGKALDDMVGMWEQWDAMLSFMVALMSRNVLTDTERQTLMDVLLETRYAFVEGLGSQTVTQDFVREQFVRAWRRLSPIFRNHLGKNSEEQSLGYLSFFTAADALSVLDGLGPTFGIEMSRDGLVRLARMLTTDQSALRYTTGVNLDLRKLFQLMPTLQLDKKEQPDEIVDRPVAPEDRKGQENRIVPGREERGNGVGKQAPAGDRGAEKAPAGPPDEMKRNAPPERNNRKTPDKPIEKDIDSKDLYDLPGQGKAPDQGGTTNQENRSAPKAKEDHDSQIEKIKQGLRDDQSTWDRPAAPDDGTIKGKAPAPGDQSPPKKPAEPDIDIDGAFDLPVQGKPPEKGGDNPPAAPKDKQSTAVRVPLGAMAKIWDFFLSPVYAGDLPKIDILRWKVPESGVDQYVKRVVEVVNRASQNLVSRGDFPASMQEIYPVMMTAMAWQESCFRQFIEKDHQMTYLLSYNNTSVGLMQVNERVWRGLYDRERLRWDIEYNAAAGGEIALLYLQKYAFRDKGAAKKMDPATVARLVYAMYNGGPAQHQEFLDRFRKGKTQTSDDLFWEKFSWVKAGNWDKINQCLSR